MRKLILSLAATPLILGSIAVSAQAADDVATGAAADTGFNIFSDVKFKAELRPRYEYKDNAGSKLDAGSSFTNRTNINLNATLFELEGLNATVEVNSVNDFNTLEQANHQTAAEKAVAKMTQANISYTAAGVTGIVGRKTLNLDNQRFIGSVGWKQNFQTLDLAAVAYGIGDFNIIGAYVYGVNAIGDDGYGTQDQVYAKNGPVSSGGTSSAAVNASYKFMDPLKLTGYAYLLGSVSDTYGLALTGDIPAGDSVKLNYRAEYAVQKKASMTYAPLQAKSNTNATNSEYINLDLGANISGFLVGANYEVLGANKDYNGKGGPFQTPLATKHKFNGWADQFLATPKGGLQDMNGRLGYKTKGFGKLVAIYHKFTSAEEMNEAGTLQNKIDGKATSKSSDLGQEIDVAYSNKVPGVNGLNFLIKGAYYMGGDIEQGQAKDKNGNDIPGKAVKSWNKDTTLAWVQLDYKFATK